MQISVWVKIFIVIYTSNEEVGFDLEVIPGLYNNPDHTSYCMIYKTGNIVYVSIIYRVCWKYWERRLREDYREISVDTIVRSK